MNQQRKPVALLVTDLHIGKDNVVLIESIFDQLIQTCVNNHIHTVLCAGDVFTNRSGQPLSCLVLFRRLLDKLCCNNIQFYCIAGNHDKTDPDSPYSYLDVFNVEGYKVFSEAGTVVIDNVLFGMIPYFSDGIWMQQYHVMMQQLQSDRCRPRILVTHIGFDGVMNNDGSKVESDLKPSIFNTVWDKVLVGHYHNASRLTEVVQYTGSAYQANYGETADDKGFTIIYNDATTHHISTVFPRFITVHLDANNADAMKQVVSDYSNQATDGHVRLVITGDRPELDRIAVGDLTASGFDVRLQAVNKSDVTELVTSVGCYNKEAIVKDFVHFCADNCIRGERLAYGLKLIKSL